MSQGLWIAIAVIAVLVVVAALVLGLVRYRRRRISFATKPEPGAIDRSGGYTASSGITFSQTARADLGADRLDTTGLPAVGDDATIPRDAPRRAISEVELPEPETPETVTPPPPVAPPEPPAAPAAAAVPEAPTTPEAPEIEAIAPPEGRLERLRGRLARSQNALGRSVLGLIGGGDLDEDAWQDVEDTLLVADLGPVVTESVMSALRSRLAGSAVRTEADAKAVLRDVLIRELHPEMDRSIRALPHADHPSVLLVVGVNGTGKTTTVGKLARVLVADGRRVVLGAADTFRAAAADQLQTWASRVGAEVVRGPEGADPASVAFDAVDKGIASGADVVLIDTAGRLHTKVGLMDELDKVKRVVTRRAAVDEVLLVLDATIGQNGLAQARVFAEVVEITGAVLTKLDGTAKGGIVFRVQQELGVPVKLVGLGEGPDDLAPFEPAAFVDALLG
ncbi:signal recognition particle-docking protein FtsY [Mycobacterium sp. E2497]|uniref:signal recognition particle-docking protein FtsY n=1 Tax=Mycobacterium sp. E2497 TaxID=1834135 RepID=UPI000801BFFE|nr:signal recognition particle-docking protein FtsY [Mycobacterium sp. E2497]OBI16971.1 signal recognition particle-docking protein FtsY [Mycobacterium sp. E2497]